MKICCRLQKAPVISTSTIIPLAYLAEWKRKSWNGLTQTLWMRSMAGKATISGWSWGTTTVRTNIYRTVRVSVNVGEAGAKSHHIQKIL